MLTIRPCDAQIVGASQIVIHVTRLAPDCHPFYQTGSILTIRPCGAQIVGASQIAIEFFMGEFGAGREGL